MSSTPIRTPNRTSLITLLLSDRKALSKPKRIIRRQGQRPRSRPVVMLSGSKTCTIRKSNQKVSKFKTIRRGFSQVVRVLLRKTFLIYLLILMIKNNLIKLKNYRVNYLETF